MSFMSLDGQSSDASTAVLELPDNPYLLIKFHTQEALTSDASLTVAAGAWTDPPPFRLAAPVTFSSGLKVTGTINANRLIQDGSNPLAIRIPDTEKGTTPAETRSNGIDFFDAEGVVGTSDRLGLLRVQYSSSGNNSFSIGATQPTAGSTLNSEIKVGWRLNGSSYERYTEAPTPPSGDESTQIATTDFVNALIDKYGLGMRIGRSGCGYINDANEVPGSGFYSVAASSANVPLSTTCLLHVQRWADNGSSGFQLIPSATGKRMFLRIKGGSQGWGDWLPLVTQEWGYDFSAIEILTKRSADTVRLLAQNLSVTKGTHPTTGKYWDFRACDSEGRNVANSLGGMSVAYASDGAVSTRIIAYKPEHGASTSASIIVGFDAEGNIVTSAPPPVTSSHFLRSKSLRNSVSSVVRSPCAWHKGCSSSFSRKSPWSMGNRDSDRHYQHSQKNNHSRRP